MLLCPAHQWQTKKSKADEKKLPIHMIHNGILFPNIIHISFWSTSWLREIYHAAQKSHRKPYTIWLIARQGPRIPRYRAAITFGECCVAWGKCSESPPLKAIRNVSPVKRMIRGVPVVVQWKQTWLVSMRMWVQSLALFSGLRTQCCCELWYRWQTWLGSGVAVAVV